MAARFRRETAIKLSLQAHASRLREDVLDDLSGVAGSQPLALRRALRRVQSALDLPDPEEAERDVLRLAVDDDLRRRVARAAGLAYRLRGSRVARSSDELSGLAQAHGWQAVRFALRREPAANGEPVEAGAGQDDEALGRLGVELRLRCDPVLGVWLSLLPPPQPHGVFAARRLHDLTIQATACLLHEAKQ